MNNPIGQFGRGGIHHDGIGSVYRANRGLRGFGHFQIQTGKGFGTFLSSLVQKAIPFLKNKILPAIAPAVDHVKQSLQNAAVNVTDDLIQGENIGDSLKKNLAREGQKLLAKAPQAFSGLMTRSFSDKQISQPKTSKATTSNRKRKKTTKSVQASKKGRGSKTKFPGLSLF